MIPSCTVAPTAKAAADLRPAFAIAFRLFGSRRVLGRYLELAVGVVYGAGHVAAIVRSLAAYGFRPRSAEWLTVFDF